MLKSTAQAGETTEMAAEHAQHIVDYVNEEEIFYWLRKPPGGGK